MRSASSPRALLGTAIHASTAAFDAARVNGEPISAYDASELLVHTLQQPDCAAGTLDAQLALQIPRNANSHVSVDKDNAFLADRQWNGQRNALPAQNLHRVGQCG